MTLEEVKTKYRLKSDRIAKAYLDCINNGEDPENWLDYSDLRNDKKRYEYFLETEVPVREKTPYTYLAEEMMLQRQKWEQVDSRDIDELVSLIGEVVRYEIKKIKVSIE